MLKRIAIVFVTLVLLVILAGGLVGFNLFRDAKIAEFFANMPPKTVTISATEVEPRSWQPGIEAIGTAKALRGVDIAVETGGVVKEIGFEANERIEAGKVLVRIDDSVERAQLGAARADLELANAQLARQQELRQRGVTTQVAYDEAVARVATARSALARLEATIAQKTISAPFAGVIGIPRIDVGEYVQPGTTVATLQDLDTMNVDFTVPEQVTDRIALGQPVVFGTRAGEFTLEGRITGIDPKVDPQTRLVSVRASVDNTGGNLRPGQFVHARVVLAREDGVIVLPQTAVVASLYGDYVYLVETESGAEGAEPTLRVRQVFVTTGRRDGALVEIVEGVEPGQTVVTSGQNKLQGGMLVKIDNTVDPVRVAGAR
jgi:membrane fusion protein (multidrug efflux system)